MEEHSGAIYGETGGCEVGRNLWLAKEWTCLSLACRFNDTHSNCQVSLEVFDKHSGKAVVFMDVAESSVKTALGPKG
jgi:hypothetical protein